MNILNTSPNLLDFKDHTQFYLKKVAKVELNLLNTYLKV